MANVYTFQVQAVYIAANNGSGTFGTSHTLESTKTVTAAQKLVSDRAQGNAKITALAAQTISYDISLDTAGFDDTVLELMLGLTAAASGSGSNLDVPNQIVPYFGLIAQTYPDVAGDVLIFWPRCKVTSDFTWRLEYGKIVAPQFKCEAIQDDTLGYMMRKRTRTVIGAITFPLSA